MTPERQKKLHDSFGWLYKPDCLCTFCAEYRDELVQLDAGIPVDETEVIDARILRRLSADMAPAAKVGANAAIEGDDFRADELGQNRKLREYTSAERNEIPLHTVLAQYFPDAFAALARHAKKANVKHNGADAPMAWAREKSTDHLNKAVRHLTTPDNIDADTGEIELVGAFWRVGAALQLREEKRLIAAGIRPLSGVVPSEKPKREDLEMVCEPNPFRVWHPWSTAWSIRPTGRVEYRMRSGMATYVDDADKINWGELGPATVVAYRPAWTDKRRAA